MVEEDFVWAVKAEGHLIANKAGASARAEAQRLMTKRPIHTRLARLLRVHTDERAYRIGADGEEEVGRRLRKLDDSRWMVLHDIVRNVSGTNIDHLVIGPPGVFSLNTKHHPGAKVVVTQRGFRVNGHRHNYLPVAVNEAKKVSDALTRVIGHPVAVKPVLVVMGAELDILSQPSDVQVIRRKDIPKWFAIQPATLPDATRQELMRAAGRPSTWKAQLTVKLWQRGGMKRTYVNDASGKSLGYRDEYTGVVHVAEPAYAALVEQALRA